MPFIDNGHGYMFCSRSQALILLRELELLFHELVSIELSALSALSATTSEWVKMWKYCQCLSQIEPNDLEHPSNR